MFIKSSEAFSIYVFTAFTVDVQSVLIQSLLMILHVLKNVRSSYVHAIVLYDTNLWGSIVILVSVYDMGQMTIPHLYFLFIYLSLYNFHNLC